MQRVEIGYFERIGHQRASTRATPRPDRAAMGLGPVDEITHNQKVARKTHLQDGVDLELKPLNILRPSQFALPGVSVEVLQALLKTRISRLAEIGLGREPLTIDFGRRELGQLRLAQLQQHIATPRNFERVGQR